MGYTRAQLKPFDFLPRATLAAFTAGALVCGQAQRARADEGEQLVPPPPWRVLSEPATHDAADEIENWPRNRPPPPGYRWDSKPNNLLVGVGMSLFFLSYLPAALLWAHDTDFRHPQMPQSLVVVPVVGPFVLVPSGARGDVGWPILDGLAQAAGAGLIAAGEISRVPVVRREKQTAVWFAPLFLPAGGAVVQAHVAF